MKRFFTTRNNSGVQVFIASFICIYAVTAINIKIYAQNQLYSNTFSTDDAVLLDGPFKHARDLNIQHLLKYDVDRLLVPYHKEAGIEQKAESYENWIGLDGHVGGHYLSAMAMNYAATGNQECKNRMDYKLVELKSCQEASAKNNPEWGVGYVGGVPNSKNIWPEFQKGNMGAFHRLWVPWYNLHKMYAGLRDAWWYGIAKKPNRCS